MLYASLVDHLQLIIVTLRYLRREVNDMLGWRWRHLLIGVSPDPLIIHPTIRRSLGRITILSYFNPDFVVGASSYMSAVHQVFILLALRLQAVLLE